MLELDPEPSIQSIIDKFESHTINLLPPYTPRARDSLQNLGLSSRARF